MNTGFVTHATAQGGRTHQEDRCVAERVNSPSGFSGWLLAVFDGHRSAETSDQASRALPSLFQRHVSVSPTHIEDVLRRVIVDLHASTHVHVSGSTASIVFIGKEGTEATFAILGDSPVAILNTGGTLVIAPNHNVRTNAEERSAAEKRGGLYRDSYLEDSRRPGVGLQMSRALGDVELDRVLDRTPEIHTVPLEEQAIVLVGSDGLLDASERTTSEQLNAILRLIREGADAQAVVQDALARRTGDNVTAIVWKG